jgi:hypothetical protein
MEKKSSIKVQRVTLSLAIITLLSACEFILPHSPQTPSKFRMGLWKSEVVADNCGVADSVISYFSSGQRINVAPYQYKTLKERAYGQMAYNPNEPGSYILLHRNKYEHLLEYVIEQANTELHGGCTSKIKIIMSSGSSEQSPEDFSRASTEQTYLFQGQDNGDLCLIKLYDRINFLTSENVTVRSCTSVITKENSFEVIFD